MVNRVSVILEQAEYKALLAMATHELRTPQDQLRYVLRRELVGQGLLPPIELAHSTLDGGREAQEHVGVTSVAPNAATR